MCNMIFFFFLMKQPKKYPKLYHELPEGGVECGNGGGMQIWEESHDKKIKTYYYDPMWVNLHRCDLSLHAKRDK